MCCVLVSSVVAFSKLFVLCATTRLNMKESSDRGKNGGCMGEGNYGFVNTVPILKCISSYLVSLVSSLEVVNVLKAQ